MTKARSIAKKTTAQNSAKLIKSRALATSFAEEVDTQLARYREMRDFDVTGEPSGARNAKGKRGSARSSARHTTIAGGLPFVIQKHAATQLHYDFRLGWAGVLKSWAVAKGPSYSTKDKRLAVQVEDHPMEYGGFEGIIPKGQYGGGTVMVWDYGTWWPQLGHENVDAGLREGNLKFEIHGTKMRGKWTLIRMNSEPGKNRGSGIPAKSNWLLIKEHDEFERGAEELSVTDSDPDSAITGRTLEQIAAAEDHIWRSKGAGQFKKTGYSKGSESTTKSEQVSVPESIHSHLLQYLPEEEQPEFVSPQLALEATTPPEGEAWLNELKLDGYRIQAWKSGTSVRLLTRKGLDWTHRMQPVADSIARLEAARAILDGEVCVITENGTTSFADLQAWFQDGDPAMLSYFVFDLLHLDGKNTRGLPLSDRKALLKDLLEAKESASLRFSDHIKGGAPEMLMQACKLHAEGIISKRADAPYSSGRGSAWLKSKCLHKQEFVIAGFTDSEEGPDRIGSLLLGYYNESGKLVYAGRSGTGFTQKMKRQMRSHLNAIETQEIPFPKKPADARRDAHWVKPTMVAQVRFASWTADNLVRQAAFLGLREDKPANEVRREEATVAPQPKIGKREHAPLAIKAHRSLSQHAENTNPMVRLTHPEKLLDPESRVTKRELADYYASVAERMLPYLMDRPLSLVRCPEGTAKPCFYQKHATSTLPPGIGSVMVPDKEDGKPKPYITLNTAEAIVGFAQMGVLEIHPWGSKNSDLERPDRIIFDLDPDESLPWTTLSMAAKEVRDKLKKAGLTSFLKITGGKGLHVVAPIEPELTWPEVKETAHNFVLAMELENPELYLTKMTKAARIGKIFLDYLRNERGATAVAPFSPRARPGMSVALPEPWTLLETTQRPVFSVKTFADWKNGLGRDPWAKMPTTKQRLIAANFKKP